MNPVEERRKEPSIEALRQWQSDSGSTNMLEGNAFMDGYAAGLERSREIAKLLREAQWTVHCGQFHQWKTLEQCTESNCRAVILALAGESKA